MLYWCVERIEAPASGTRAVALYDRESNDLYELPLRKGDVLKILSTTRDVGWWKASAADGSVGLVPSNFVHLSSNKSEARIVLPRWKASSTGGESSARVTSIVMNADLCCSHDGVAIEGTSLRYANIDALLAAHAVTLRTPWKRSDAETQRRALVALNVSRERERERERERKRERERERKKERERE